MRPLLLASLAVVLLDLGLTELAPGASARRAELLGEKTARPTSSRFSPFVYRADSFLAERSEEHTSELQSQSNLVCRLLLEKKKKQDRPHLTSIARARATSNLRRSR